MAYTAGGGYLEDQDLRPVWPKSYKDPISANEPDMVVQSYNLSHVGGIYRKIAV
jgi:hypothetical protein